MTAITVPRPETKVVKSWRGWGVKVRWPRSGPWSRTMVIPRYVWHGPFGNSSTRWPTREGAETCRDILEKLIADILTKNGETAKGQG